MLVGDGPYVRNEFVPLVFANQLLEAVEEVEAFLVRDRAEGIVGVFPFEVDNQFRELVIFAVHLDRVLKSFPANDCAEVAVRLAVNLGLDAAFQIRSPAFVQPCFTS